MRKDELARMLAACFIAAADGFSLEQRDCDVTLHFRTPQGASAFHDIWQEVPADRLLRAAGAPHDRVAKDEPSRTAGRRRRR